jgi:hypothetical protein
VDPSIESTAVVDMYGTFGRLILNARHIVTSFSSDAQILDYRSEVSRMLVKVMFGSILVMTH